MGGMRGVLFASCLALTVTGCTEWFATAPPRISPTTIGVIARADVRSPNLIDIVLSDGQAMTIDGNDATNLDGGVPPETGGLLLLGNGPDGMWYEVLRISIAGPEGCFGRSGFARREGDRLVFDDGLVLGLASDFDPGIDADDRFDRPGHEFCLNEAGEAASYR